MNLPIMSLPCFYQGNPIWHPICVRESMRASLHARRTKLNIALWISSLCRLEIRYRTDTELAFVHSHVCVQINGYGRRDLQWIVSKHVSGWLIDGHMVTLSASLVLIGLNHTCLLLCFHETKKKERKQGEIKRLIICEFWHNATQNKWHV